MKKRRSFLSFFVRLWPIQFMQSMTARLVGMLIAIILLLSILLGGSSYWLFSHYLDEEGPVKQRAFALAVSSLLQYQMEKIQESVEHIAEDPAVSTYAITFNAEPLLALLHRYSSEYAEISYSTLEGEQPFRIVRGKTSNNIKDVSKTALFIALKEKPNQLYIGAPRFSLESEESVIDIGYRHLDYFDESPGGISVAFPIRHIRTIIDDIPMKSGTEVIVTDVKGNILASKIHVASPNAKIDELLDSKLIAELQDKKEATGSYIFSDVKSLVTVVEVPGFQWKIFLSTPLKIMHAPLQRVIISTLIVFFLALFIGMILIWVTSRKVLEPIKMLTIVAASASDNIDFEQRVEGCFGHELGGLIRTFNKMLDRLQDVFRTLQMSESQLIEAERLAKVGSFRWDIDKNHVELSPQLKSVFGRNPEDIESLLTIIHPDDVEGVKAKIDGVIKRNVRTHGRCRLILRNRANSYIQYNLKLIEDRDTHSKKLVGTFQDITELKNSQSNLEHLVYHDPLTGLPNRMLFNDRLEHALNRAKRERSILAILFLDLDQFKTINDSYGHSVGDEVLKVVANRFKQIVRDEDTLARVGGDEFIFLIERVNDLPHVSLIAEKLFKALRQPIALDPHSFIVNTSIGISLFPENGIDLNTLVKNADAALNRAKEEGRNNYQFYTSEITMQIQRHLRLKNCLYNALDNNELFLYYQLQISAVDGHMIGFEALLRWLHPEEGFISPAEFIPVAESSGLMLPIGLYVIKQACRQRAAWRDAGLPPVRIAINLSGQQINLTDIAGQVRSALEEYTLDPSCLELEVTEGSLLNKEEEIIDKFRELKNLGVSLAIDDFGTGYSSLSYLKRLPVNKLKIDQSFVQGLPDDIDDQAIVDVIIALGHSLNLKVIAEGVETEEQRECLITKNCDELQGYLISRPLSVEQAEELLRNGWN